MRLRLRFRGFLALEAPSAPPAAFAGACVVAAADMLGNGAVAASKPADSGMTVGSSVTYYRLLKSEKKEQAPANVWPGRT